MKQSPALLTAAVFLGLLLPWLLRDGMFLDGVTYAAISRNLAHGLGTFWAPHYTDTLYPEFFEHPPLVFGIQSLFFRILGDGMATERIYTMTAAILSLILIAAIWRQFADNQQQKSHFWVPVLLWISTPVVFWSYRNNMLENTLTVFVLAATWFTGKTLLKGRLIWLLPAGFFLLAAFLTKGPVGLFPLAIPLCYWFSTRMIKPGKAFVYSLLLIIIPVILFSILMMFYPQAGEAVSAYLRQQVLPSLNGGREVSEGGRFGIFLILIGQSSTPFIIILIVGLLGRKSDEQKQTRTRRLGYFFLLAGLSASLPLVVTLKQHDYYLVPAIPFFAVGLGLVIPATEKRLLPEGLKNPFWLTGMGFVAILALFSVIAFVFDRSGREKDLLLDVRKITSIVPAGSRITASASLCTDWRLIACLSREANISLDGRNLTTYYLTEKQTPVVDSVRLSYETIGIKLNYFKFLKRK